MPNWCSNSLTVAGPPEARAAFVALLPPPDEEGARPDLLGAFLPLPEPLARVRLTAPLTWETDPDDPASPDGPPLTDAEAADLVQRYGHDNWYSWSLANWGVKWDVRAFDGDAGPDRLRLVFDSAWSPPLAWAAALAARFPALTVTLAYAESGSGFAGAVTFPPGGDGHRIELSVATDGLYADADPDDDEAWPDLLPHVAEFVAEHGLRP